MTDRRPALARVPPYAEDAERALLGAVLVQPEAYPLAAEACPASDLYVEAHRAIYEAMGALAYAGTTIDAVTLSECLRVRGQLDRVGGPAYLSGLMDPILTIGTTAHVESHAAVIREKAKKRRLILACSSVVSSAFEDSQLADLHRAMADATNDAAPATVKAQRGDGIRSCLDQRPGDVLFFPVREKPGTETDLGSILGGFTPGEKFCVAGVTNSGKTGLVISLAVACADAGIPTGYFALEDPQRSLEARTCGILVGLSPRLVLDAKWTPERRYDAGRVLSWFQQRGFHTFRMIGAHPDEVCNSIQSEVVRHGLRVVIVDYLQAAAFTGRQSRTEQIDNFIKGIERASGNSAVAVLVSQLKRKPPGDKSDPDIDDLRDSGAIGHLSRSVVFVIKDGEETAEQVNGKTSWRIPMRLLIAKNKGPMGSIPATLHNPDSFVWPGTTRPTFRWEADAVPSCEPEADDVPHPAEQQSFDDEGSPF